MSPHPWLPNPELGTDAASTLEMLQTDVMRFLAILALCLMAIFALVQSLPPERVVASPQLESRELMAAEAEALEARVEALRSEHEQLRRSLAEAREALAASTRENAEKRVQLARLDEQIKAQAERLGQERAALAKFNAQVHDAKRTLAELKENLATLRAEIDQSRIRLASQRQALEAMGNPETAKAGQTPAAVEPPEATLELRFESDRVLTELVRSAQVAFYARSAGRFWRLEADESGLRFTASRPPKELYEMRAATVPMKFVEALRGRVAMFDRNRIVWGVTLPPAARQAIAKGSRDHRSGILVIGPDAGIEHRAR